MIGMLKKWMDKKKAREVVINAEVMSHYTGVHVIDIIKEVYQRGKGKNIFLGRILREYKKEKPKRYLYRDLFDNNFLAILKMAEEKHIPTGGIFKDYQEVNEKLKKAKGKIISAIVRPGFIYFIAAIVVYWTLGNILTKMNGMKGLDLSMIQLLYNYFWFIILGIAFGLGVVLFKFPRYVPVLKGAYKELDAFQYLSFCLILFSMGIPSTDIVSAFRKVMKVTIRKRGIEGLLEFFSKYLTSEEIIALRLASQTYEYERVISSLLEKRRVEFDVKIDGAVAVLGELLNMVVMLPVGFLLLVIMNILAGVSSLLAM